MIEDQELGMVEGAQAPDYTKVASDMVAQGATKEQLQEAKAKLQASGATGGGLTESAGKLEGAFDKASASRDALSSKRPEAMSPVSLEDIFGGVDTVDFSEMFAEQATPFQLSIPSMKESSVMASTLLDMSPKQIEEVMGQDQSILQDAYVQLGSAVTERATFETREKIAKSQSADETISFIEELDAFVSRPLNLADLRKHYAASVSDEGVFDKDTIAGHISQNLFIAEEIQKASQQVWKSASYGDIFKDIGQLVIPFTGYAEEEINKWSTDYTTKIKQLKDSNSPAEAKALIDELVSVLKDTQTPIIERNNSLFTLQTLDSVAEEFRNGAYGWVDGVVTEEDVRKGVESVAFGVIEASGIGGVFDVVKTLGKRILPTSEVDIRAFVPQTDEKNIFVMQQREGSSVMDSIVQQDATPIRKDIVAEGVKETSEKLNLTPDQASDRMMPSLSAYIAKTIPNTELSRVELNQLNLSNLDINTMKTRGALQLQKDLGESGVVQVSDVVIIPNEDPTSLGEFVFHVGGANGSWFKTQEEALAVQSKIFGKDSEIVEVDGQYAVRASYNHIFNPRKDVEQATVETVTGKARLLADTMYTANLIDPLRILGEDFMSAVSSVTDVNRSKLSSLADTFTKAIKGWTPKKQANLGKILQAAEEKGLNGSMLTRRDLPYVLQSSSQKELDSLWESYSTIREVTEDLYRITDNRFRLGLEAQGWKNGVFGDETDFVRLPKAGEVEPTENVFDVVNNRIVTQAELQLDESVSLVKSMNPRVGPDGDAYDLLVVKNTDTGALPPGNLLNKQEGYIPRYYTETGWTIKQSGTSRVNGVDKPSTRVTHIVRTKADAKKAKSAAITRQLEEYKRTIANDPPELQDALIAQEKARLESSMQITRSRENAERDIIWGKDSDVSFGFGSANSKAKGERLSGSEGLAPVLDPVSAISRRINGIGRDLNHPVIASMQSRFNQRFSNFLKQGEGTPWNPSVEAMLAKNDDITVEAKMNMRAWHGYIESLREIERAPIFGMLDNLFEKIFEDVPVLGNITDPLQSSSAWMKKSAAMIYIIGRPLFQIPTNMLQMWAVTGRSLAYNPFSTMRGIASIPIVLAGRINKLESPAVLSRVLGIPESEAGPLMKFLFEESGLVKNTDFTDDILSMATDELVTTTASSMGFYAKKYGKGTAALPLRASSALQTKSLQFVNLHSFLTEVVHEAGKGKFKLDARMKENLLFKTRRLTQTQNRANQYKYQNSTDIDGLFFQFMQHVQKMLGDLVIEPTYTTLTGRTIKRNVFTEDRRVATAVTVMNLMLFGTAGFAGSKVSREAGNATIEEFPEVATDPQFRGAYESLRGGIINSMLSGFSDRITPAAYIDSVYQMFDTDDGLLSTLFGAAGSYTSSVFDLGLNLKTLAFTPDLSNEEVFYSSLKEAASLFSGAKDMERAYIAYNFGILPYASNLSGTAAVSTRQAIASAFSITPEHISDFYNEMGKRREGKGNSPMTGSQQRINDLFVRQMNRELVDLQESGTENFIVDAIPIRQKWIGYAKAAHGLNNIEMGEVENYFKTRTLAPGSEDFDKFVAPYLYTLDREETMENLRRLANTTENPRLKEFVEAQLTIYTAFGE